MYKRTKIVPVLVLALLLAGVLSNCASLSQTNKRGTITIAVVESNPGTLSSADPQSVYAGVKLALDRFKLPSNGVNIQVNLYNDENDPAKAAQIAGTIASSDAVAVIGHSSIEASDAAGAVYDQSGIPVINAVPVSEHLTENHPYYFNITYTAEAEAAYIASYLIKADEKFTAGIIHTDSQSRDDLQIRFRNLFASHGGVVTFKEKITLSPIVSSTVGEGDASADVPAIQDGSTSIGVSDAELIQLNDIVNRIIAIPDANKPNILFIAADEMITNKLDELLREKGVSIAVKGTGIVDDTDIANMIGTKTASIISTDDGYGEALAKQFRNTFVGLGGKISVEEKITAANSTQQRLEEIVSHLITEGDPGTIFIATDDVTAAKLIVLMKRKGLSFPVAGASSLSTPAFLKSISAEPEEGTFPGYFTNGILTTRALIFDSANRYANQFLADYQSALGNTDAAVTEPGDRVVDGYDAALALVTAIQSTDVGIGNIDISNQRQEVFKALLSLNSVDKSAQGIIGPTFFQPSRDATRAVRFGIYQNGEIVSANTQFEPISSPNEVKDLQSQIDNGRIMTVNGGYVYKANVVYAGVDILSIDEIDIKTSTYNMDFYLWFRYRPNEKDEGFKPDDFVFTNANGDTNIALIRDEANSDGTVLKTYRVNGGFKNQFRFYDYPFEHQDLIVEFRNQNATTSFIQYVVDRTGMRYESDESQLLKNFSDNGAFNSIFGWEAKGVHVAQDIFPTFSTFGSPQNFGRTVATNYSLIDINVDIQRDALQYIVKSLLPLMITLVLAYITFFLPLGHSERLAVGSTALLTTAFFHLTLADALPQIGYTVAMEYLFYASYLMSALIVLLETLSIRLEKQGEDTERDEEKQKFQKRREELNMLGRVLYPAILFLVLIAGIFVYNGFSLAPSGTESKHIVDLILEAGAPGKVNVTSADVASSSGDQVKLTLSTWRPEDSEKIQELLNQFQEYAQANGKNIVIEHRPVVSVNYNSILDIQLSRGEGPDLFYVRPFSVDGNIARYLTSLNDLPIDENYDATKIVPWKNKSGSYFAVPYVGVVQAVYYNENFFKKYPNIPTPDKWTSWGDFLTNIKKIKATGKTPIANALNQNEDSEMFMSIAANFLGGPGGRASLMKTDGSSLCYNNQKIVKAFQAIEDLKPYLPADAATINSQTSKELFFNQDAVLLFGGSWDLQTVMNDASFEWDVFAVPAPSGSISYVIFQPDVGVGINRDTQHPEEARMFLKWLMTKEAVDMTAKNLVGFYPLNSKIKASGPVDEKFLAMVNSHETDIRWMYTEISNETPSALEVIRSDLHNMIASDLTPQESAQNLQNGLGEWYEPAQNCK